jgi:hypothetical protein
MSPPQSLVLRWREETTPQIRWYLRGIRPDGSYYGEIRSQFNSPRTSDNAQGIIRNVEGQIARSDADAVFALAAVLRKSGEVGDASECRGVLADGPINQPTILFRFLETDRDSEKSGLFIDIVRIVRPYLAPLYSSLSADAEEDS